MNGLNKKNEWVTSNLLTGDEKKNIGQKIIHNICSRRPNSFKEEKGGSITIVSRDIFLADENTSCSTTPPPLNLEPKEITCIIFIIIIIE